MKYQLEKEVNMFENTNDGSALYPVLGTAVQSSIDLNCLIKEAIRIRKEFEKLDLKLRKDEFLWQEYALFLEGKIAIPGLVEDEAHDMLTPTPEFVAVLNSYSRLANDYHRLRDQSVSSGVISPHELIEMETASKKSLPRPLYCSAYQAFYEKKKAEMTLKSQTICNAKFEKILKIDKDYSLRSKDYKEWHDGAGFMSLMIVGIPFFIGGLVVHSIDKIITSTRIFMLQNDIQLEKEKLAGKEEKLNQKICNKLLSSSPQTLFKQYLFNDTKVYEKECPQIFKKNKI